MQFTGTVKSFDEDEGKGIIVRDRDKHEIVPKGLHQLQPQGQGAAR